MCVCVCIKLLLFLFAVPPSVSAITPKVTFFKGDNISISFLIDRASPVVDPSDIVWFHNGVELNTSCLDCEPRYSFTDGLLILNITDLQVSDDGSFTLRARNPAGYDEATTDLTVYGELLYCKLCRCTLGHGIHSALFCKVIVLHVLAGKNEGVYCARFRASPNLHIRYQNSVMFTTVYVSLVVGVVFLC